MTAEEADKKLERELRAKDGRPSGEETELSPRAPSVPPTPLALPPTAPSSVDVRVKPRIDDKSEREVFRQWTNRTKQAIVLR